MLRIRPMVRAVVPLALVGGAPYERRLRRGDRLRARPRDRQVRGADLGVSVLVLDDFLLAPITDVERRDLLEVLEDRYDRSSTVLTSQPPIKTWHQAIGEATIADAICDRLVHNAHVVTLRGGSMRKKKAISPEGTEPKTDWRASLRSE